MSAIPPSKEAMVVLFDVGRTMCKQSSDDFDRAKKAVSLLIKAKIRSNPKDEVGIVLMGSKNTRNVLNNENKSEYKNIEEIQSIVPVNLDMFEVIDNMQQTSGENTDFIDGLTVAITMIQKRTGKRKYSKRIYVVTDAAGDVDDDGLDHILSCLQNESIMVNVIGVDFTGEFWNKYNQNLLENENEEGQNSGDMKLEGSIKSELDSSISSSVSKVDESKNEDKTLTQKEKNELLLQSVCVDSSGVLVPVENAIEALSEFRTKKKLQRTTFRGIFEIGEDIKIPIWAYKKSEKISFPTAKKKSILSDIERQLKEKESKEKKSEDDMEEDEAEANFKQYTREVKMERLYYNYDEPDKFLNDEERIKAYRYGNSYVPFNEVDEIATKFKTQKCVKLLGFTKRSNVPRYHYMGETLCFVSKPDDKYSILSIETLVASMIELDRVAIVRYVFRDDSEPKMGIIVPAKKSSYSCFYFNQLPYIEDLRQFHFQTFSNLSITESQLDSMDKLIDEMDLTEVVDDSEGESTEALIPSHTFNPIIQHFNDVLHEKALSKDKENIEVPKVDDLILKYCFPENFQGSFYNKMINSESFKKVFDNFKKEFPLQSNFDRLKIGNSLMGNNQKERQKYWFAPGSALEEIVSKSENLEVKKEQEASVIKQLDEGQVVERLKSIDEEDQIAEKIDQFGKMFDSKAHHVGTKDPINDFKEMVNRKDMDIVERAIKEMSLVIEKLIEESIDSQLYTKALQCLKSMREECIKEDESDLFNNFLDKIKSNYAKEESNRNDFWKLLRSGGISLIHEDESSDSKITIEQSKSFLSNEQKTEERTEENNEEDEDEDLFDELE